MPNLLTILTVRTASERLPAKCLQPVKSRVPGATKKETAPLIVWIVRRLRQINGALVVATTNDPTDNELTTILQKQNIEVIRGSRDDVVSRMEAVLRTGQYPGTDMVFRALGDCPFICTEYVEYAAKAIERFRAEAFVYMLNPECYPVYSTREFPYSIDGFNRIVRRSTAREHPDVYFHKNRREFKVVYHMPPPSWAFRPYRLEVDYPADLELVRAVADGPGMLAHTKEVISFLDANPDIARINTEMQEKTGPLNLNTYSNRQRREWLNDMIAKPVLNWDGKLVEPPGHAAVPIFCTCGHTLGWGWRGRLHLPDGSIMAEGFPKCRNCGLIVREWRRAA